MKTLGLVTLSTLISYVAMSQSNLTRPDRTRPATIALSNDPVFNAVLSRRVSYPIVAIRSATYGRIYAGFDIDASGRVQNITILSPENTGVGFEYEIKMALKRMPSLNPAYTGRYALPVSFVLLNWGESSEPHVPTNVLPRFYLAGRQVLDEVIFQGSLQRTTIYSPITTSKQIIYY